MKRPLRCAFAILLLLSGCRAAAPAPAAPDAFSGALAYAWVERQCALGPRLIGSPANLALGDLIIETLTELGWTVAEQRFEFQGVPVRNILAWRGEGDALLLGAHYDTRRSADHEAPSQPVLGANDGASGVAVLLELARSVAWERVENRVYLAFFDAEDNGNLDDGWPYAVGSRYMAEHWGENGEPPLQAVVVVDMIGDADQQIYYEVNSDPALMAEIWAVAAELGLGDRFIPQYRHSIIDDHTAFARRGIPAIVIIDFDYPYWHTLRDTPDKVSPESLGAVGRTLQRWLERRGAE